ncbi:hypothetical protein EBL_c16360 [Shimwellia blattae DSM 4481 = NBRC 105725]|uniref:UPF0509 protein YciZ n=1 Tax=Shimwellia blattae (strain ATCC 29907 / DSM 4481 / JCM 1650 / NBRC 105725 / CDC 9005-74) TaxID=630626 RepID=I2B876_SHIBC|nr:hypothetical protein [Shimwellia blattae]AFJ46730.1 hypothetical protein EBL_c16360 [Shimwellia blattae DSM 4481 = NBRC 105725]GAB82040.1 hypothetical protein YciZ [Shimwellia blattae DSM 4481 = NBRC 105725]VEC22334.1 Uncharacterised protein [Shimwellia blattae]
MTDINLTQLTQRIDTVLDILVAGDYASAINNLEILKAELQALSHEPGQNTPGNTPSPWEI